MFAHTASYAVVLALLLALALSLARPSQGAGAETRYVVRAGDTLWSIAATRYSGDPRRAVWRIEQRNGLSREVIQPGTVLYLPA
jgi:nucleoid-associated protein YgaU